MEARNLPTATPILIERFQEGDAGGYAELFHRYQDPLRRFVLARTDLSFRRLMAVDDVLQEVHLQAIRSLDAHKFIHRRQLSFFFWLCGIARNVIAQRCRQLKREPPVIDPALRTPTSTSSGDLLAMLRCPARSPQDLMGLKEHLDLVALALSQLGTRRQDAIILRYLEGMDTREAAAALEISPGAFRVLLSRALIQLRQCFDVLLDS